MSHADAIAVTSLELNMEYYHILLINDVTGTAHSNRDHRNASTASSKLLVRYNTTYRGKRTAAATSKPTTPT